LTTAAERRVNVVELTGINVRFVVPTERIISFKEYVLRRMRNQIHHRELWALKDVNLTLEAGETLGLVGRNGAGKSTLLKVMSRVLRPTSGRVIVRGRAAPLLELGAGFHFDLTGRENVFLNATLFGYSRSLVAEHLPAIVEFSELEDFIDMPVRNYSNGMLARLGFAVATQFRPDILILDEILAVGDTGFQQKCLERIESFRELGTSILLVSHELETLAEHCDRVAWLEHGQLMDIGQPQAILEPYRDAVMSPADSI
jgi:ABC-2 type transport system ATP-binding protein/lipopolysaccharide transport system ATP-binding protein